MYSTLFRRLHRWIALIFALPLLIVVVTGLILSFLPLVHNAAVKPGSLTVERLQGLVKKYDPAGEARSISLIASDNRLTLEGLGKGKSANIDIDLTSGELAGELPLLSRFFAGTKELHRRFVFGKNYLTIACALAMLALAVVGLGVGFSRPRRNLSGWHKATAWALLPLLVVSPLTGALDGLNIAFIDGAANHASPSQRLTLTEAIGRLAGEVDPSAIYSLTIRGPAPTARILIDGELRPYRISSAGVMPAPRNWPRNIHEGDWWGAISALLNVVASTGMLLLLVTGLTIWARRETRQRAIRRANRAPVDRTRVPA